MSSVARVTNLPPCSICVYIVNSNDPATAVYDGRTRSGAWAYMCEPHFIEHGSGLGTGLGQRLILATD